MKTKRRIELGLDLNCFTNRYVAPEEWTAQVASLGIHSVQYNADILDPNLPWKIQNRVINETLSLCRKYGIKINSSFGGHNHHQNYLGHPDKEIASYYEGFYKRLIKQTALLGGSGVGTCYAIMTVDNANVPSKKNEVLKRAADGYHRLADYAKKEGLSYLLFETTSVPRETCATFEETDYVLDLLKDTAVPFKLCLDVGHKNMANPKSPESDCYSWIRRYGPIAPVIHIHQCNDQGSHHWPFTPEYNPKGAIDCMKVINAISESGAEDVLLALEVNHKSFYPYENQVIPNLELSVKYWRSVM